MFFCVVLDLTIELGLQQHKFNMKFDWKNWNVGGKTLFVSACIAALSMLMNWVDIGFASASGISQGTVLLLALWIYPLLMLFKGEPTKKILALLCSIGSLLAAIFFIMSKTAEIFGKTVNLAGEGAYIYSLASIAFIFAVLKYKPNTTTPAAHPPNADSENPQQGSEDQS